MIPRGASLKPCWRAKNPALRRAQSGSTTSDVDLSLVVLLFGLFAKAAPCHTNSRGLVWHGATTIAKTMASAGVLPAGANSEQPVGSCSDCQRCTTTTISLSSYGNVEILAQPGR